MSSLKGHGDHVTITANSFRNEGVSTAIVTRVQDLSPTVKQLTLNPHDPSQVTFKAGQWVDFFIPSVSTIGGFSMCSAPNLLKEKGELELAVKFSKHPPANWVHSQCRPNSNVAIKVGGNFFFDPAELAATTPGNDPSSILLIAGGVGINPLVSILRELKAHLESSGHGNFGRCLLLYSAAHEEELLFKKDIDDLVAATDGIDVRYFVTQEKAPDAGSSAILRRRIDVEFLRESVFDSESRMKAEQCSTYICGPPTMIDDLVPQLHHLGLSKDKVFYEKWW